MFFWPGIFQECRETVASILLRYLLSSLWNFFFLQVYVHLVCPKEKEDTEPSSVSATVRYYLENVKANVI